MLQRKVLLNLFFNTLLLPWDLPTSMSKPDSDKLNYEMTSRWKQRSVWQAVLGLWFGLGTETRGEKRAINRERKRWGDQVDDNAVALNGCYHKGKPLSAGVIGQNIF